MIENNPDTKHQLCTETGVIIFVHSDTWNGLQNDDCYRKEHKTSSSYLHVIP